MVQVLRPEERTFARRYEERASIDADVEEVFAVVDDHAAFSSHMSRSSWMMGGGRMETTIDEGDGRRVGSHLRMRGRAFGIPLYLDEVVTEYEPPRRKAWETVGEVNLLVVGHYRMRVEIEPEGDCSLLRVSLEYDLPSRNAWLGRLFGRTYARWCVRQMIDGVREWFDG